MRIRLPIALLLTPAVCAQAGDGLDLAMRSKAMAAASAQAASIPAHAGRDPLPELLLRAENERREVGSGCGDGATQLCYDIREARMVYRGARQYMPQVEGLRAESLSLRRDGIVLRYSFR